jgi:adenosylcobinamide-phosphate synthase
METVYILLLALAIDLSLGELPTSLHPVSWMGKVISLLVKGGRKNRPSVQIVCGIIIVLVTLAIFVTPVYFLLFYLKGINPIIYVVVGAVFFKITFSLRGLQQTAMRIRNRLAENRLNEARFELRSLVGRKTAQLNKDLMISATVESVAENCCDSFIAPLFYFLFLGVPGAVAYRVINTLDAMIGHHGEFEYLGKVAARLDTVANLIPARITALIIVLASWIWKKNAEGAWQIMLRDRRNTESPNAGWTMGAIAGALGVQLEKVDYYKLGDNRHSLTLNTIDSSVRIILTTALIWSLLIIVVEVIYHVAT